MNNLLVIFIDIINIIVIYIILINNFWIALHLSQFYMQQ